MAGVLVTLHRVTQLARHVRKLERVPSPIQEARSELHQALREARAAGFTLEQIGEAAGVSKQRVYQLLERKER